MTKVKALKKLKNAGKQKSSTLSGQVIWRARIAPAMRICDYCTKKSHYGVESIQQANTFSCPRCSTGLGLVNYKHIRYLAKCWQTHVTPGLDSSNMHLTIYQPKGY